MARVAKKRDAKADEEEQVDWAVKLQLMAETLHNASIELTTMVEHLRAFNRGAEKHDG